MRTLIIIWLAVLVVGVITVNRVQAWTSQGVNVYRTNVLQNPIGLQSQPSQLQPAINVKEF